MPYDQERADYVKTNRHRFAHYGARQRDKLKEEVVAAYGGKCCHCGINNPVVLCLDHINDDAHIEKELYGLNARGGHKIYGKLKAQGWPKDRFQLLCYNCNAVKEHERRRKTIGETWGEDAPADRQAVQAKIGLKANNSSGLKGVFWNTQKQRWQASIMINYKKVYLGAFTDMREAAIAYRAAAIEAWGENANVQSDWEIEQAAQDFENQSSIVDKTELTAEELGL